MSLRTVQVEAQERFCDLTGSPLLDGDGWHVVMTKGKQQREGDLSDEAADTLSLPETVADKRGRPPKAKKSTPSTNGRSKPRSEETKAKMRAAWKKRKAAAAKAAKAEATVEAPAEEKAAPKPSARKKSARKAGGRLTKVEA